MEVQVDRDALLRSLQLIQNIVEPRQTLPILANVLVEAEGEWVRLTGTDLEVAVRVSAPASVTQSGAITLSARKFGEIVRELPPAAVTLKLQENAWVTLRCGGASYKLVGLPPEDFPSVGAAESASWVTLDGKLLRDMLAQTSFAISQDESRYALNGLLFSVQDKELRLVATDGHRLALVARPLGEGAVPLSGIVPQKAVRELERVLGAGEQVHVAITENQFVVRMPNFLMWARLIEGVFPNYEQVVPKGHPRRVRVARAALSAALRRVSVLSEERTKPVKFTLSPGTLRLSAYHADFGEAEESLEVEYAGEEVTIGFNSRYVLEALAAQAGDLVLLEVKDEVSAGILRSAEEEGALCVIMPMRI